MLFKENEIFAAYRKFKSYVYYDNTSLFIRDRLATFESQEGFESKLIILTNQLNSFKSNASLNYFHSLLKQIDFKLIPKKIDIDEFVQKETVITNRFTEDSYEISRLTYLIDAPIELHIVSVLWLINGGYSLEGSYKKWNYAYRLDIDNKTEKIKDGLSLFKKYFIQYREWRDTAIHDAKSLLDNNNDVAIIGLDIKNYFHSVNLSFQQLKDAIPSNLQNEKFGSLTTLLKSTYIRYSKLIDRSVGKKRNYEDNTLLPIGMLSSGVIANWYLKDFDDNITTEINPVYYGRYVDDILLVISNPDVKKRKKNKYVSIVAEYMEKYFIDKGLLVQENDNYRLIEYENLSIQNEKIILYDFDGEESSAVLEKFEKTIKKNSSEFRFLPEDEKVSSEFDEEAHSIIYEGSINKLRIVTKIQQDKYGASKFLAKKIFSSLLSSDTKDEKTTNQILSFFKGRISLEFLSLWEKIATYFVINDQPNDLLKFYKEAIIAVNSLDFSRREKSEVKDLDNSILEKVKTELTELLSISCSLAFSLEPGFLNNQILAELEKLNSNFKGSTWYTEKIVSFRKSNLLRHAYVFHPLLNYTNYCSKTNKSLISRKVLFNRLDRDVDFKIDFSSSKYSPRWIRLYEASQLESNKYLNTIAEEYHISKDKIYGKVDLFQSKVPDSLLNKAFNTFFIINHPELSLPKNNEILKRLKGQYFSLKKGGEINAKVEKTVWETLTVVDNGKETITDKFKIAVANLKVEQENQLASIQQVPNLSRERRLKLFKLLNNVNEEGADLFVLPENSVPYVWLDLLITYAKDNFLGIIVGLEHIIVENIAFNFIATILPIRIGGVVDAIIDIRLKNHYAPKEENLLEHGYRYRIPVPIPNKYTLFSWRNCKFSVFYCYELANIYHRSLFRSKVDFLVASEYNPDINYFSNIVESVIRDVHCYFIQANSSDFGDSRVSQPKRTELIDILRIEGGENDTFLVTELDIRALRNFQNMDLVGQMIERANNDDAYKLTPPDFNHDEVLNR